MIAIIPARGGSKRVPNKNIISLHAEPLIHWTIKAALDSKLFESICVSTDSNEIADIAIKSGAEVPFLRGKEDSDDITPVHIATINALIKFEFYLSKSFDVVVQLMPNCPLRSGADIINAYNHFCTNKSKFQISVFKFGWMNPWWALEIDKKTFKPSPIFNDTLKKRSQDLPDLYCPTGAVWIADAEALKKEKTFYGHNYSLFPMDWVNAIDIDDDDDLEMARMLAEKHLSS